MLRQDYYQGKLDPQLRRKGRVSDGFIDHDRSCKGVTGFPASDGNFLLLIQIANLLKGGVEALNRPRGMFWFINVTVVWIFLLHDALTSAPHSWGWKTPWYDVN